MFGYITSVRRAAQGHTMQSRKFSSYVIEDIELVSRSCSGKSRSSLA